MKFPAVRSLLKNPGYAAFAVLVIALGVGVNTAVFTVVNTALFAPLPYRAPDDLVRVATQFPTMGFDKFWISAPEYLEYREWSSSFEEAGAFNAGMASLQGGGAPFRAQEAAVTASLFRTLGISAALGRVFGEEEDRPGTEPVVVLSHGLWQRAFGADPGVLGTRLLVDGVQHTVIGVLPKGVDLLDHRIEVWTPLALDPADLPGRGSHNYIMVARLAEGAGLDSARAELPVLLDRWRSESQDTHAPHPEFHPVILVDLHEEVVGEHSARLLALLALSGVLLFAACANLGNLVLGRAEARRGEIAVRTALGSGRFRSAMPFLGEGFIVAGLGGALGVFLAAAATEALVAAYPGGIPRIAEIGISWPVLGFAVAAVLITGLVSGAAPAAYLATGRQEAQLLASLQSGGLRTTPKRRRLRQGLVAFEIGLSAVLLISSLLLVRSLFALQAEDPGFAPSELSAFQTFLPETDYPESTDQLAFLDRLSARIERIPGVEAVTMMSGLPPRRRLNANDTLIEGLPESEGYPEQNMDYWQFAGSGYFETMGIPLLAGRGFTPSDDGGATPVAVVNRTAAELFWPDQDPIGRRLKPPGSEIPWFTVIGVAKDVKQGGLGAETGTEVYFHYPQTAAAAGYAPRAMHVVLRSELPPEALAVPVREAAHELDPALPVDGFRSMEAVLADSLQDSRFLALLLTVFAALAVALAAAGSYSVVSALAAERTAEIGVRMAFGAGRAELTRLILSEGMRLAAIGLAAGLVGALFASRLLQSLLFGVRASDPSSWVATLVIVLGAAVLASIIPARRSARIQPIAALRHG